VGQKNKGKIKKVVNTWQGIYRLIFRFSIEFVSSLIEELHSCISVEGGSYDIQDEYENAHTEEDRHHHFSFIDEPVESESNERCHSCSFRHIEEEKRREYLVHYFNELTFDNADMLYSELFPEGGCKIHVATI